MCTTPFKTSSTLNKLPIDSFCIYCCQLKQCLLRCINSTRFLTIVLCWNLWNKKSYLNSASFISLNRDIVEMNYVLNVYILKTKADYRLHAEIKQMFHNVQNQVCFKWPPWCNALDPERSKKVEEILSTDITINK